MASKRSFVSVFSSLSVAGGILALAPSAFALCPDPDPGALPYVTARATANVCNTAALTAFNDALNAPNATWTQVEAAVTASSAACSACIFSSEADSAWGPLIKVTDGVNVGALVNYGACFERAAGGSFTCGGTLEKFDLCVKTRCSEGPSDCSSANIDACQTAVASDPTSCGQYDVLTDCPNYATLEPACGDLRSVITVMCGGTFPTNGGTTDAGVITDGGGLGPKDGGGLTKPDGGKPGGGKKDASAAADSGDEDEDNDNDNDPPKKDAGKASTKDAGEDEATGDGTSESGCAQSGSSPGGSIAGAMTLMFAVGSVLRARRRSKR